MIIAVLLALLLLAIFFAWCGLRYLALCLFVVMLVLSAGVLLHHVISTLSLPL